MNRPARLRHAKAHNKRSALAATILPALLVAALSCGNLGDPGNEPAGWENLPLAGVSPFLKIDSDGDPDNSSQPFVLHSPEPGGIIRGEPDVVRGEGGFVMWFTDKAFEAGPGGCIAPTGSIILRSLSEDGVSWSEPVEIGMDGLEEWADELAGPSVLRLGGEYHMWFARLDGSGVGHATSTDGLSWVGVATDIVPDQAWEGGPEGSIGGLSVLHDGTGYRMWYHGGPHDGRAIGHAWSDDGVSWTKADEADLPGQGGNPVFAASQDWEAGSVWGPCVIQEQTSHRRIYKMYYTAGILHEVTALADANDASIGFAASEDGLHWERVRAGINPILDEPFILDAGGLFAPYCPDPFGTGPWCELREFASTFSSLILSDEHDATVVRKGDEYLLFYTQVDFLNFFIPCSEPGIGIYTCPQRGIGLATNPPRL